MWWLGRDLKNKLLLLFISQEIKIKIKLMLTLKKNYILRMNRLIVNKD